MFRTYGPGNCSCIFGTSYIHVCVVCTEIHGWRLQGHRFYPVDNNNPPFQTSGLTMNKLIILDRDGVINQDSDQYVKSVDEWVPIPGSIDAIVRLCHAGYKVIVATNQSGLGRGYFQLPDLDAMHAKMNALIEAAGGKLDGIFYCPHSPDAHCDCRKPLPGLIHQAERLLNLSAKGSIMVGDSLRDLQAGQQAGCIAMLVLTGKGRKTFDKGVGLEDVEHFTDLAAAVDRLLS